MSKQARILIVEDERIPAEFLKAFLQENGFEVIGLCSKGQDAIEKAIMLKPDVIFMDIILKDGISGSEAALKISSLIQTKIIFLTAHADEEMIEYALDAGAVNYLIKPYKEKQIITALKIALHNPSTKALPVNSKSIMLEAGYVYDLGKKRLYKKGREIDIGYKSLRLIHYLCRNINSTVSSDQLSYYIYGEKKDTSTLRTLISRLKKTLGCDLIHNVNTIGYKIFSKESK